jgi:hypothetical protein
VILPFRADRIPELIGQYFARRRHWTPAGHRVTLTFDESGDNRLFGTMVSGVIREAARDEQGEWTSAIVELDREIDYAGHYSHGSIRTLVTLPYLQWHRLARLLVTSAAVRVIDVGDIALASNHRTIGLATMRLGGRPPA